MSKRSDPVQRFRGPRQARNLQYCNFWSSHEATAPLRHVVGSVSAPDPLMAVDVMEVRFSWVFASILLLAVGVPGRRGDDELDEIKGQANGKSNNQAAVGAADSESPPSPSPSPSPTSARPPKFELLTLSTGDTQSELKIRRILENWIDTVEQHGLPEDCSQVQLEWGGNNVSDA